MEKVILEINNLTAKLPERFLFKALNLKVREKQILGIFAPTGTGKSTLLKIIADFFQESDIQIEGNIERSTDMKIGMVFQSPVLLENQTSKKNILLSLNKEKKQGKNINIITNEILEKTDLKDKENIVAKKLSGGEKQRLCIARCLAGNNNLLLLDEPFSSQDENHIIQLIKLIKQKVNETNSAAIFVSHDINQIKTLCTDYITL